MSVSILIGDAREKLRELPDQSVHCCVTSPPYFGLRDYGCEGQMGLEPTPDEFVAGMVAVFREVRRVLRDDGVLFLNLGDSYFGSGKGGNPSHSPHQKQRTNAGSLSVAGRATACGTSDKAPEDYPASDCFCRSLCGACREAYRIGISHSARSRAPMPSVSSSGSIREHTGSPNDPPPTLGSAPQRGRSEAATPDLAPTAVREAEPLLDALASTSPLSLPQPLALCSPSENPAGECRLCARSLADCVPAFGDTGACICDSAPPASVDRNRRMDASGLAYPSYTTESLKPKDLIGIPWRVAFALQADGWYLRQDIIWSKPNPMPESVRDRCTKAHEYLFLLSKGPKYHFDAAAIAEPLASSSVARLSQDVETQEGSDRVPGKTNGKMKDVYTKPYTGTAIKDYEGTGAQDPSATKARIVEKILSGELTTRNKRSVWEVTTQPFSEAHFATYPPALIEPCILAGCPVGGTVLDPFGGAGTTGLVADRLGRNAILVELNPEYAEIAERRLTADAGMFAQVQAA